jgi:predicted nucleotidyltransferase
MDKSTVVATAQQYAQIVARELSPFAIVLYGSYAKGNAHTTSDIDVAVVFNNYSGDWLTDSALLWKLRRGVSDDIEPILLDRTQDPSGFVADIFRTGEVLYSAG